MNKIVEIDVRLAVVLDEADETSVDTIINNPNLPKKVLSSNIIDTEIFDNGIDMDKMMNERYNKRTL